MMSLMKDIEVAFRRVCQLASVVTEIKALQQRTKWIAEVEIVVMQKLLNVPGKDDNLSLSERDEVARGMRRSRSA